MEINTDQIQVRYSRLAEDTCCLSCGGAIDYSKAKQGEVCIDLGSGRGTDVLRLAEQVGDEGFVYGIDVTDAMLRKAEKSTLKLGVKNVKFIKSKLEQIQIPSETANLVISNCTINHADDKYQVWSEVKRILKKSGRFVVSDIYSIGDVPEEYKNDPMAVAECWAGAVTKQEYIDTLTLVGFIDIEIIEESAPNEKGKVEVASFTIIGRKKCCG
jgi:arsenite methyltransferase